MTPIDKDANSLLIWIQTDDCEFYHDEIQRVVEQRDRMKELLQQCRDVIDQFGGIRSIDLVNDIKEVLKQ